MTTTAANVNVGVDGGAYVAPSGTTLPTTPSASLNAAFEEVGYISEDGVVESQGTDSTEIKAWQNGDVVRTIQTKHTVTYAFTMIETTDLTQEVFYGNYTAGVVQIKGDQLTSKRWVIEVLDGTDHIRIVIPDGQVTERGDVTYKNDETISYPITITCYPDGSDVKAYKYLSGTGS